MSDKTVKSLICDQCEAELIKHTSYPAQYSLELRAIDTNINDTGAQFAVMIRPPLDRTHHFCGMKCLRGFLDKKEGA